MFVLENLEILKKGAGRGRERTRRVLIVRNNADQIFEVVIPLVTPNAVVFRY